MHDGAVVTKTDATPLVSLNGSDVITAGALLSLRKSPRAEAPTTLDLGAAPLLLATNSTLTTTNTGLGSPCCNTLFISQGALLTSTNSGPLIQLTNSSINNGSSNVSGASSFTIFDQVGIIPDTFNATTLPSTVSLAGGLVRATNSTITSLFSGLDVTRSNFTGGSASSPVFQITNTANQTWSFGGVIPQPFATAGTLTYGALFRASAFVPANELPLGNANIVLNGPLLNATNATFNTTGDLASVFNGASFASTTSLPLITSSNSAYNLGNPPGVPVSNSRHLFVVGAVGGLSGTSPALASFRGPLLDSTNDIFNATGQFVQTFPGGGSGIFLTRSNDANYFMQFTGSTVKLGAAAGGVAGTGNFLEVDAGTGMSLNGPVASVVAGATPWTVDSLVRIRCGAGAPCTPPSGSPTPGLDTNGNTSSLFSFTGSPTGGPHQITGAMFDLAGTATTTETDSDARGLTVGSDRPLRHGGTLFEGSSTSASTNQVVTNQVVKLDTALLEATAPILKLLTSTVTSSTDALNLSQKAKLTATLVPGDALVKLNASTLNINSGSLVNVAGGSFMSVRGNLVSLDNNSTLNILAGSLFSVSNGSVFRLTGGSLGVFGSTGTNTINITNTAALCNGCSIVTNITNFNFPVLLKAGASTSNVSVGLGFTPFAGLSSSNRVNISGASGAVFVVDATSKVKLGP